MITPFNPNQPAPHFEDGQIVERWLTENEYVEFKAGLRSWKMLMLAKFLRATGLRTAEVLSLERRHCDLRGPVFVVWIKRKKQRGGDPDKYEDVYLSPEYGVELRAFLEGNGITPAQPVFFGRERNKKMDRSTVRKAFNQAGVATIGRPVNPHELRHLFVTTLHDQGVPMAAVARMVGHTSAKTTETWYYDLNSDKRRVLGESVRV